MGMVIVLAGIIGALIGFLIGGIAGFIYSKKKNKNKLLWTILDGVVGFIIGGTVTFFGFLEYVNTIN